MLIRVMMMCVGGERGAGTCDADVRAWRGNQLCLGGPLGQGDERLRLVPTPLLSENFAHSKVSSPPARALSHLTHARTISVTDLHAHAVFKHDFDFMDLRWPESIRGFLCR